MGIIEIRKKDIAAAQAAFADFMLKTEDRLNDNARRDDTLYKDCGGNKLETVVLDAMREVSPSTPFSGDDIVLKSGHMFPDIVAGTYYGVEVKSTVADTWKSTGSSIVESSRIPNVEDIYMMFGKLGGERAVFRCRPYGDCLCDIGVTHSPRYMIDMDLPQARGSTIFDKMGVAYDEFRMKDEKAKIDLVRSYYKQDAMRRGKTEMPWWIGDAGAGAPLSGMNLRLYSELEASEKESLVVTLFVLFPEVLSGRTAAYGEAAMWMCSRFGVLSHNTRDLFSAGGRKAIPELGIQEKMDAVFRKLFELRGKVRRTLNDPSDAIMSDLRYYSSLSFDKGTLYSAWCERVDGIFKSRPALAAVTADSFLSHE